VADTAGIRSLVWATDVDVLPVDRVVHERDGYLAVRSPGNPAHYWGNFLLFGHPPASGDRARWERLFDVEFGAEPRVRHRTFAWDRTDGSRGSVDVELLAHGYELEQTVGLIAASDALTPHPRENRDVRVRALDPEADGDSWEQVVELQLASRDKRDDDVSYEGFCRQRLEDLRTLFRLGRGSWYVALDPAADRVLASCGIVVTDGRGRFQSVDTAAAYRRRGICSRLVVEAAHHAARRSRARQFVIAADPGYHALGLYESLGFRQRERVCGVCRRPSL
jgi:ribosomal protein S18 acetylase RimI-like enzyme